MSSEYLRVLYDESKKLNAGSSHMTLNGIFKDDKATGVIAVYNDEKPHHKVLEDFEEYIESRNERESLEIWEIQAILEQLYEYEEGDSNWRTKQQYDYLSF